jgi:hypothetical protein
MSQPSPASTCRQPKTSRRIDEVEVTLDDGRQVDVQLDGSFNVVGSEGDREEPGES